MSTINFQELKDRYANETLDQVIPKNTQNIIAQGHDGVYTRIPMVVPVSWCHHTV